MESELWLCLCLRWDLDFSGVAVVEDLSSGVTKLLSSLSFSSSGNISSCAMGNHKQDEMGVKKDRSLSRTNDELDVARQKVFLSIALCDAQETVIACTHENRSKHNREVVEAHFCLCFKSRDLFQVPVGTERNKTHE